jgi:hypothetical protein
MVTQLFGRCAMNTNLQQRSLPKAHEYKGYKLISDVLRCGIGGNMWEVTVAFGEANIKIYSVSDDAHVVAMEAAKAWIDGRA